MRDGEWIIFEVGRDSRNGQLISVRRARRRYATSIVQVIRRRAKPAR